ncbi:MAG: SGNH/GDSL hydrolase family protein [Prevotellaceae bacterium]|nr:SGNH/GDSL hydrolase family protein [Prevotellaceae bacterium]
MAHVQDSLCIAVLGDSNTWLGGDECDKPQGWTYWLCKQLQPNSCRSYARSGATWTHTDVTRRNVTENTEKLSDDNVIFNQVCRLQEAVDAGKQPSPNLIIIAAGTNDAWFSHKRPKAFDMPFDDISRNSDKAIADLHPDEVLTLADVIKYDCALLRMYFPEATIILLTPMQSTAVSIEKINSVSEIIVDVAQKIGAEVIRMDKESCVRREQEKKRYQYTYDGTHTNEKGACNNGYFIVQQIGAILQLL